MSENEIQQAVQLKPEWEKVDKAHDKYRASGLTLMSTVIGLSTGALYGLHQASLGSKAPVLFCAPILLALLQEWLHFLASQSKAQFYYHWALFTAVQARKEPREVLLAEVRNAKSARQKSDRRFGLSDDFCSYAIIALILVSFISIVRYKN